MNKLKNIIFKSYKLIIAFILGVLLSTTTTVLAYKIYAEDISFTPNDINFKKQDGTNITNIKEAVDELYNKSNNIYVLGSIGTFSNNYENYGSSSSYSSNNEYMTTTYDQYDNHVYINIHKDMKIKLIYTKTTRGSKITYTYININNENISTTSMKVNTLETIESNVKAGDIIDISVGYGDNTNSIGFIIFKN